jgi:hypothetical protein
VSIHTLVGAAHILLTDLCSAANQEAVIQRYIKPEMRSEVERAIRRPQNFLKHADKDPHGVLDFDPHATELLLLIEVEAFRELTGSITDPMKAFLTYAAATWGKAAFEAVPSEILTGVMEVAAQVQKSEFFRLCLQALGRRSVLDS